MIYNTPLRFTTRHLAQRFLIDDETFMISPSNLTNLFRFGTAKVAIILVLIVLSSFTAGLRFADHHQ